MPPTHGKAPFRIALLHGGPGSLGDMAAVARALSRRRGVLEPWSTAPSLRGQVAQLAGDIARMAEIPVTLAGHSWGAWLAFVFAARHPASVRKLILIDCPPFEERYERLLDRARVERLSVAERSELPGLLRGIEAGRDEARLRARLDELMTKVYAFDPLPDPGEKNRPDSLPPKRFQRARDRIEKMRRDGSLLELGRRIHCPVVIVHGTYDPLPIEGVTEPLRRVLDDVRVHELPRCGHTPWKERQARDLFLRILEREL